MDNNRFLEKYKALSDSELLGILADHKTYQAKAITAAGSILSKRGTTLSEEQLNIIELAQRKIDLENQLESKRKSQSELSLLGRRFWAFIIDLILLSLISYILSFVLIGSPIVNPPFNLLFDFILIVSYFGISNSMLIGCTLGNKFLRISILDHSGSSLSLQKSLLRSSLIFGPYFLFTFLSGLDFYSFGLITAAKYIYYAAIIYFLFIDKNYRRGYHEILTHSFAKIKGVEQVNFDFPKQMNKFFYIISGLILVISIVFNVWIFNSNKSLITNFNTDSLLARLEQNTSTYQDISSEVQTIDGVSKVNGILLRTKTGEGKRNTSLIITVSLTFMNFENVSDDIYNIIVGKEFKQTKIDFIEVKVVYGRTMTLIPFEFSNSKVYPLNDL